MDFLWRRGLGKVSVALLRLEEDRPLLLSACLSFPMTFRLGTVPLGSGLESLRRNTSVSVTRVGPRVLLSYTVAPGLDTRRADSMSYHRDTCTCLFIATLLTVTGN